MENLDLGLMLMVVGMITVFAIFNKVAPEEVVVKKTAAAPAAPAAIDPSTMAAIKGAVNIVTAGKGKVMKVERI